MPWTASKVAAPIGTPVAIEQQRVLSEAVRLLQEKLAVLNGRERPNKSETSDLLREVCQNFADLAAWQNFIDFMCHVVFASLETDLLMTMNR